MRWLAAASLALVLSSSMASRASAQESDLGFSVRGPAAAVLVVPIAFYGLWIATWPVTGFWSDDVVEDDPLAITLSGAGALGLGALSWWATDGSRGSGTALAGGAVAAYGGMMIAGLLWAGISALGSDPRSCSSPLCKKLLLGGSVLVPLMAGLIVAIALPDDDPAATPAPLSAPPSLALRF